MRSRAPPVADAARRSTRSGRKNRASEQREDFFGHRKAVGADTPWLPLERICAQYGFGFFSPEKSKFVASTAKRQGGLSRGKPGPPLPCFASFCRSKRKAPAASGANYAFVKGPATPTGEIKLLPFAGNPSVSLAADSLSLRLGHGAALICHRHIIHYRAATSLPLTQGNLWGGVTAGWLLEYHITVITLSKNDMSKKRFFCVTNN